MSHTTYCRKTCEHGGCILYRKLLKSEETNLMLAETCNCARMNLDRETKRRIALVDTLKLYLAASTTGDAGEVKAGVLKIMAEYAD